MDPEVVAQFNSLQQTGNYIPSGANGSTTMSSTANSLSTTDSSGTSMMNSASNSLTTTGGNAAPIQTAVDAFFAVMSTQEGQLGLLGLSP